MQEQKDKIAKEFKISENDNGSTPVQIALITSRIERLTEHSKLHKHDYSCLLYTSPSPRDRG